VSLLNKLAAESRDAHLRAVADWEAHKLVLDARKEAAKGELKAEAKKKGADSSRLEELAQQAVAGDSEVAPTERRYLVNDVTVEKLQMLMAQNPDGLTYFRDELSGLFRSMEKQDRESDKKFFLECSEGLNSYRVERVTRDEVYIERACLAVFGTIQPGPLSRYINECSSGEEADGFIQRFQVMVYPDPPMRFVYVNRRPNQDARDRAYAVFKVIDLLDPSSMGCEVDPASGIPFLRFSTEAQGFFEEWYTKLQNRLRCGTITGPMASHLAKYGSLMPSLALQFHLIATPVDSVHYPPVSLDAAEMAAAWCELLESHAVRIYNAASDGDPTDAIHLAQKIKESLPTPFRYRDAAKKG
jgi:putative DNA primase/helicase